jgi:hypothetical protein
VGEAQGSRKRRPVGRGDLLNRAVRFALGAIALTGCDLGGPCDTSVLPAVVVTARDSITDSDITDSLRGTITWDGITDSLIVGGVDSSGRVMELRGGPDQAGTYDIHLERPGYLPYDRVGIVVNDGRCHADWRWIVARMVADS